MSNLASMIMEGSGFRAARLTHSYDHENGAGLIAMESAEALRDIFEAEFYVPNTCTIQATLEGASCVAESSQAAIMEASIKGAFEKIKDFFIKLKEKVKDLLHNIKRYLLGIFGNDEKWIKEYEKDLKAIPSADLKDYKVKMYKYTIEPAFTKENMTKSMDGIIANARDAIFDAINSGNKGTEEDKYKEECDELFVDYLKDVAGKSIEEDEIQKALWSKMRDGADSESDKDDVSVASNMNIFIEGLKKSSKDVSAYDATISKINTVYDKVLKLIADAEKQVDKVKDGEVVQASKISGTKNGVSLQHSTSESRSRCTACLRVLSSFTSKIQGVENQLYNTAKAALVERNAAYKKALLGAFGYAKKNKSK